VPIDFGCRAGSCGTCVTRILSGAVRYLHQPNAPTEVGEILPCIALRRGTRTTRPLAGGSPAGNRASTRATARLDVCEGDRLASRRGASATHGRSSLCGVG